MFTPTPNLPVPVSGLGNRVDDVLRNQSCGVALCKARVGQLNRWIMETQQIIECRIFQFVNHVHSLSVRSLAMGIFAGPERTFIGQDGPEPVLTAEKLKLGYDRRTEQGMYEYARRLCVRTVMALQVRYKTKDGAIQSITREYRLGSFITKLWKGQNVVIKGHKLECLKSAHDRAVRDVQGDFAE